MGSDSGGESGEGSGRGVEADEDDDVSIQSQGAQGPLSMEVRSTFHLPFLLGRRNGSRK